MIEMKDSGIEWIGEIPKDWEIRKIKHLFTIFSGTTPKSDNLNYWDGDIPWITPADYKTKDKYVFHGKKFLTKLAVDEYKLKLIPKNSIVFSKRAPIGEVAITSSELATNQGCLSCIINKQCDVKYFYFTISVFSEQFNLLGSGTTFKEISSNDFENFVLPFPQLNIQHRIAEYLDKKCSKIDEIISKQQTVIEKLKEYKLSIITEAVTKGLNPDVTMKDSGVEWIGEIPEHWKVRKLKYLSSIFRGSSPRPIDEYLTDSQNGFNWIKISDTKKGYKYIEETKQKIIPEGAKKSRIVHKGDLLLTNSMSFGEAYILGIDGCIHDGWVSFSNYNGIITEFLYYFLLSKFCYIQFKKQVDGGVVQNLNIDKIGSIFVFFPSKEEQKQIVDYLDSKCEKIDFTINKKQKLIDKLTEYKKSLIYEVVTGKKEV